MNTSSSNANTGHPVEAGYIGSHTSLQLLSEGHDVLVIDNPISDGNKVALERIQQLMWS